jgi:phage terminase small subunit
MAKQPKKLSPKQHKFCEEYLIDLNATQAYIRAGYSPKGAEASASTLLRNTKVQEQISLNRERHSENTGITVKRILDEIATVAFNDKSELVAEAMKEEDPEQRKALLAMALNSTKDADKLKALDMLGKHTGIYEEDNKQSKPDTIVKITREIVKK